MTTELNHIRQAMIPTHMTHSQKIAGTNSVSCVLPAHAAFEDAIHQQLQVMDQNAGALSKPPAINSAHEAIRKKLLTRTLSQEASTGYPDIQKSLSSKTENQRFIINVNSTKNASYDGGSHTVQLERSQNEIELHLLLESHFKLMESGSAHGRDTGDTGDDDKENDGLAGNQPPSTPVNANLPSGLAGQNPGTCNAARPISITLPTILEQPGHICKPTSLANVDQYYAGLFNLPPIPLRKNSRASTPLTNAGTFTNATPATNSVRQLAKLHRSRQGEVLKANDYARIAKGMGYSVERFSPKNSHEFATLISTHLQRQQPLTTCFAVDIQTGKPTRHYQNNEHACVITGINLLDNTLEIAHWGQTYSGIPIDDMYASMNALPETREQEFYRDEKNAPSGYRENPSRLKYEKLTPEQTSDASTPVLESIIPETNSGFKNLVFLLTPQRIHPRWSSIPAM